MITPRAAAPAATSSATLSAMSGIVRRLLLVHADVAHREPEALDHGLERFLQTEPAMVGADRDGLIRRRQGADSCSSGSSTMRTPRAAATSRADAVTMAPTGTRSSPPAGMSCAVTTRFINPGPLYNS